MKLNKMIARAFVLSFVVTMLPVFAHTAKATTAAAPSFLGTKGEVKVDAAFKLWAVAKVVKTEKAANLVKDSEYYSISEIAPVIEAKIDLSSMKKNKDIILAVGKKDDIADGKYVGADWTIVKIPAEKNNIKVIYTTEAPEAATAAKAVQSEYGNIVITEEDVALDIPGADSEKIEVRTETGAWKTAKVFFSKDGTSAYAGNKGGNEVLQMLTQKGAKLYFRKAGIDAKDSGPAAAWPSKEVSLKIPAQDKAPKIKINTAKEEIGLSKGMSYGISDSADTAPNPWKEAAGKVTFTDATINGSADKFLFVKKTGTGKKLESKVTKIKLEKSEKPTVAAIGTDQKKEMIGSAANGVTFSLKLPYDLKKGATLTNTSDKEYEVQIIKADSPDVKAKWMTLKPKKTSKDKTRPGTLTLKYSAQEKINTFGADGMNIFFREVGGKKIEQGAIKMYSPVSEKSAFVPKKVEQEITVDLAAVSGHKITQTKTYKGTITLTKIFKEGVKPKIKVLEGGVKGVTIKVVEGFKKSSDNGVAKVELTVKKTKKLDELNGKVFKFKVTAEGAEKEHSVNITAVE